MATLFDAKTRTGVHARIDRLEATRAGLWGKMNAPQMVCHAADQLRVALHHLRQFAASIAISLAVLLATVVGVSAEVAGPYLVKDINPFGRPADSRPHDFVDLATLTLFVTESQELWRSDGSAEGTYPLVDRMPATSLSSTYFLLTDRQFFFLRTDENYQRELWVTDGSVAGTRLLAEPALEPCTFQRRGVYVGGSLLFAAADGEHGCELWRSDGTPGGTHLVVDLRPGAESSSPAGLSFFKGQLYFTARDDVRGSALWRSNGTAGGTRLVKDTHPGDPQLGGVGVLGIVGSRLLLVATSPGRGLELWSSDGTAGGTRPLPEIVSGPGSVDVLHTVALDARRLVLAVDHPSRGEELWVSDGTAPGTRALTNFRPRTVFDEHIRHVLFSPHQPAGRVIFSADDGVHGTEPWVTDGTPAGTRLLRDVCPGSCASDRWIYPILGGGGKSYFAASNPALGNELWVTEGTQSTTRLVKDICLGSCSSYPYLVRRFGGRTVFAARDDSHGLELWRTDGSPSGTFRLTDFPLDPGIQDGPLGSTPRGLLFEGFDPEAGRELWRSNGTRPGTHRLADLDPRVIGAGSSPALLGPAGDQVLFFAEDGARGAELWKSDGTAGGTSLVFEFAPGPEAPRLSFPEIVTTTPGELFFVHPDASTDFALWKSDGTPSGTVRLTPTGVRVDPYLNMAARGDAVFFAASDPESGSYDLWRSDGTPAGTVKILGLDEIGELKVLRPFAGAVFFFHRSAEGEELWRSDGTAAGTSKVHSLFATFHDANPPLLVELAGRLYFFAAREEGYTSDLQLWATDGTVPGTVPIFDFNSSEEGFFPNSLFVVGQRLFIFGSVPPSGGGGPTPGLWLSDGTPGGTVHVGPFARSRWPHETPHEAAFGDRLFFMGPGTVGGLGVLWVSDGTAAGTTPFRTLDGQELLEPRRMQVFAGRLFFVADAGDARATLWQSDGTPAGTSPVFSELGVFDLAVAGEKLFFSGWTEPLGPELWALQP